MKCLKHLNLVANCQIGCHLAGNGLAKGSHNSATLFWPAMLQIDCQSDNVSRLVAALHFWLALWQDTYPLLCYPYIANYAAQN